MLFLTVLLAVLLATYVAAEVTVLQKAQYIYDKSPKLRIRGSGFEADDHDIRLELGVNGQDPLVADKDFLISKDADGDGLILKLLGNRRYNLVISSDDVATSKLTFVICACDYYIDGLIWLEEFPRLLLSCLLFDLVTIRRTC